MLSAKETKLRVYGAEGLTADEAFTLALEAEEILSHMGPFDPAREYFFTQKERMERAAYLLSS